VESVYEDHKHLTVPLQLRIRLQTNHLNACFYSCLPVIAI